MPLIPGEADAAAQALRELLVFLQAQDYCFVTPTPLTHRRQFERRRSAGARPGRLDDLFGWNLPFVRAAVAPEVLALMEAAGILAEDTDGCRSRLRVSRIDDALFLHSAFPTEAATAVFFGPDTYRFVNFLRQQLSPCPDTPPRVLDVGCGSGAGGVLAARYCGAAQLTLSDINPAALRLAAVNAVAAGVPAQLALGDALAATTGEMDLILCNPPYLVDAHRRAYRHGGERLGRALGLRIATEAVERLANGGRLLLYTGVAIIDGHDPFIAEMAPVLERAGCQWDYGEIDPDVFGEELEEAPYHQADRIAAVGLVVRRRGSAVLSGKRAT